MKTEYEFQGPEEAIMADAAKWSKILAIVTFINGGLQLINCNIIGAGVNAALGALFLGASKSFQTVVDTQGSDIAHTLQALEKIGSVFMVRIVLMCIALGLMVLVGFIFAMMAASGGF